MILCIRGMGGNVGTTVVLGSYLLQEADSDELCLGSVLSLPKWRNLEIPSLREISFAGWDIHSAGIVNRAREIGVLSEAEIAIGQQHFGSLSPRPAPIRPHDVPAGIIHGEQAIPMSAAEALEYYKSELSGLQREDPEIVAVNLSSTESVNPGARDIRSQDQIEKLIVENSSTVTGGLIYAIACIQLGVPFCDFTPDATLESPVVLGLAVKHSVPVAGKDGNTGQTYLKLVLTEMLVKRNLRIAGWYSANVLGNTDGLVLSMPEHAETKLKDKIGAIEAMVPYDFPHAVTITYEPSRGDWKESWDTVNVRGWLNRPMALRINWCAEDSILAAPVVLDIARLLCLAHRRGEGGIQTQLSPFFKCPIGITRKSIFDEIAAMEHYYGV